MIVLVTACDSPSDDLALPPSEALEGTSEGTTGGTTGEALGESSSEGEIEASTSEGGSTTELGSTSAQTLLDDTEVGESEQAPDPFVFREEPSEAYVQVDRAGFPFLTRMLLDPSRWEAYNGGNPNDDRDDDGPFFDDIIAGIDRLHFGPRGIVPGQEFARGNGLADEILVDCAPPDESNSSRNTCLGQFRRSIFPDRITIALGAATPRGRQLEDRSLDIALTLFFVDLPTGVATIELADAITEPDAAIAWNPVQNDVSFLDAFPYLAPPH